MRNVVAACCCAIVGLEVLIAVPLITCLAVLGVAGGVDVQHVASDPPMSPQYAGPSPYLPPPQLSPAGFDGPVFGPPPLCPAPPTVCSVPSAATPPTLSPQVEAIAEARERVGSPLAESSLAGDPATTRADTIAILEQVAAQDAAPPLADSPAPQLPSIPEPIATLKPAPEPASAQCLKDCPAECPAEASLVGSLRSAADQLYIRAQALEIDGNFGRADQIRTLAREIRTEIDLLRRETNPQAPTAWKATDARDEPSPVSRAVRLETVNPLEPTTIGLVEPATFDAPLEPAPAPTEVENLPQIPVP